MEPLLCSWLVLSSRLGVCILFEAFRELEFARLFIRMNFCPAGLACNFFTFSSIALRAISGTSLARSVSWRLRAALPIPAVRALRWCTKYVARLCRDDTGRAGPLFLGKFGINCPTFAAVRLIYGRSKHFKVVLDD